MQFPITYHFYNADEQTALSGAMPYLLYTAKKFGAPEQSVTVHFHATLLRGAINDFADTVGLGFLRLPSGITHKVLVAYAHDHFRSVSRKKHQGSGQDW